MSHDTYFDDDGDPVDVVSYDYCPDAPVESRWALTARDWAAAGWDIDPRPGRDRCPDCAAVTDEDTTTGAGRRTDVAAGVP